MRCPYGTRRVLRPLPKRMLQANPRPADLNRMRASLRQALLKRLVDGSNPDGSWGYLPRSRGRAEPTALATLALAAQDVEPQARTAALSWLGTLQQADGAVSLSADLPECRWPTALVTLAWLGDELEVSEPLGPQARKAVDWLLNSRGQTLPPNPRIFGHDTTLSGWSWSQGTHSFVEPTALAMLALRLAGQGNNPRVREGVRVLLDRALPDGGWNYGNTRVIDNTLRPFPATTGLALAALGGEPDAARIEAGIRYLLRVLPSVRAPLSLSWGLIGLAVWDAHPRESESWLSECAVRALRHSQNVLYDALLILANAEHCPLTGLTPSQGHGGRN